MVRCIGYRFATLEGLLTLVRLYRGLVFRLAPSQALPLRASSTGLTLVSAPARVGRLACLADSRVDVPARAVILPCPESTALQLLAEQERTLSRHARRPPWVASTSASTPGPSEPPARQLQAFETPSARESLSWELWHLSSIWIAVASLSIWIICSADQHLQAALQCLFPREL